ncbi:calmodulin-binding protein 60 B-like [Humulus lupulus]|uniref:calmodulin-binding protein 60 B-like n=1 Tax=Humulus lupulus TaxID=3486 RepID=UPI002B411454|nr:calmodulin-binding protein 60 B-like [Humulus lupulus]
MTHKRHSPEEGHSDEFTIPIRDSKRRPVLKTFVGDLTRGLSPNEAQWEPFFRRVIRDQVERTVCSLFNLRPSDHQAESSKGGGLRLQFVDKLPSTIFTNSKIISAQGTFVHIILTDANNNIVDSGPFSSLKIKLVALNGEFGSDDQEYWTEKEFNDKVVREREGKRPLVIGELDFNLRNGVANIVNVTFTDNSSWIRSGKFRLGARVVQKVSGEIRIREARSEPFVVKDHRGELYQKHHPPSLHDEVWRLEKIAKDGKNHRKLAPFKIETVKDFLQMYTKNSLMLREILGNISNKNWDAIVGHALTYVEDNKFYACHSIEHDVSIYFNSILKIKGARFSSCMFSPEELTQLSPSQRVLVENLKQQVYENKVELVPADDFSSADVPRPLASLQAVQFNDQALDQSQHDFSIMPEVDQSLIELGLSQSSTLSSYPCGAEVSHQLELSAPQNNQSFQMFPQTHRNSFSMEDFLTAQYNEESSWFPSGSQGSDVPSSHFTAENLFCQLQTSSFSPITTWEQGPSFIFTPNTEAKDDLSLHIPDFLGNSRDRKHKASWCKIRAAFKCWLSVKLAARKMARPLYLSY